MNGIHPKRFLVLFLIPFPLSFPFEFFLHLFISILLGTLKIRKGSLWAEEYLLVNNNNIGVFLSRNVSAECCPLEI